MSVDWRVFVGTCSLCATWGLCDATPCAPKSDFSLLQTMSSHVAHVAAVAPAAAREEIIFPVPLSIKEERIAEAGKTLETHMKKALVAQVNVTEVDDVLGSLRAGANPDVTELEDLEDVVSLEVQTAEMSEKNHMLLTVDNLANMSGGVRGEDVGKAAGAFEGDMVADSPEQLLLFQGLAARNTYVAAGKPWKGGSVKYCYASDTTHKVRLHFLAAAKQLEKASCLTFKNVGWKSGASASSRSDQECNESPAVFVISRPSYGCYSVVGMSTSTTYASQPLQLEDPGCAHIGVVLHEIGHALGMAHEHSRPDRDKYVRVLWENVKKGQEHNFAISSNGFTDVPYDYISLMHYDAYGFTKDITKPTLEMVSGHGEIGQRSAMGKNDVDQIAAMYAPEVQGCKATAISSGTGCFDMVGANGEDVCTGLTACSGSVIEKCCACSGGITVQCYEGAECPSAVLLPPPAEGACVEDATALFGKTGTCIYHNKCAFAINIKCPPQSCTHTSGAGSYMSSSCAGKTELAICAAPSTCIVWNPAAVAPSVAATTTTSTAASTTRRRRRRRSTNSRRRRRRRRRQAPVIQQGVVQNNNNIAGSEEFHIDDNDNTDDHEDDHEDNEFDGDEESQEEHDDNEEQEEQAEEENGEEEEPIEEKDDEKKKDCKDTNGHATNHYGKKCVQYAQNPQGLCGEMDDDDFASNEMCCVCGGGSTIRGHASEEDSVEGHDVLVCRAITRSVTTDWCNENCNAVQPKTFCPKDHCKCRRPPPKHDKFPEEQPAEEHAVSEAPAQATAFEKLETGNCPAPRQVSKSECLAAAKTVGADSSKTALDGGRDAGMKGRPQGCTLHNWGNVEWWGASDNAPCGSLSYNCVCKKESSACADTSGALKNFFRKGCESYAIGKLAGNCGEADGTEGFDSKKMCCACGGGSAGRQSYIKHAGAQCDGSGTDVLRAWAGTEVECKAKCDKLSCVGFVRVNSGSRFAGQCFFRKGPLQPPSTFTEDDRDCYQATPGSGSAVNAAEGAVAAAAGGKVPEDKGES